MAELPGIDALTDAVARLRRAGVVPGIAAMLRENSQGFAARLRATVLDEVPAYTESGNPEVLPELQRHLEDHVDEVCGLLAGNPPGPFGFIDTHAERRAEQKFPLDAMLQAYRCLHRLLAPWIRDAAIDVAADDAQLRRVVAAVTDFTIEYTGLVSTQLTARYVDHTRRLAEAEGDRRLELLNTLLDGYDESDRQAARLLRRAGYLQQRQSYCVAVARSVNPAEMENPARARRMADAINKVLASTPLHVVTGIRDNLVVIVMSATRRLSGWTAPQSLLADRVYPQLCRVGPAALIGLSNDVPSTSHIPGAAREAQLALDFASVSARVMPCSRIPFRQMLLSVARDEVRASLPSWLDAFTDADTRSRGALSATLSAYADASMNVMKAAESLSIHPNTIYARMQKIDRITGRNPLEYHALTELLLVTDCAAPDRPSMASE
jgi:hypothetical protein